ncbi:MAG: phage tail family protein, partial [Actinobacteria bacterium]|nr:phage tail family protein [Actinomycetota bacterium]
RHQFLFAFPIIAITFKQSQTHIYLQNNNINDCRFDISKAFVSNDVLVLDTKTMSITLNDIYSPAGFGDGGTKKAEFIILRSGANEMQIGTDDATIKVDVNVFFRKTYL